jgi:hypothetical protein
MSRRIAQRPRYRDMRYTSQFSRHMRQESSRPRWMLGCLQGHVTRQMYAYQERPVLGRGLLLVPFYRFVHSLRI